MQKTLYILRHAKAAASSAGMTDKDRPLAERGQEEARRMGEYLAANKIIPQRILCSTSKRTRQTLEGLVIPSAAEGSLGGQKDPSAPLRSAQDDKIQFTDALYLASARDMLRLLSQLPDDVKSVMLIGHNPGLHELAIKLARRGDQHLLNLMTANFPPCALAEIQFDGDWKEIKKSGGTLARFVVPAMI